jgi:phenylalanyl-tRNA synthetase beta chain
MIQNDGKYFAIAGVMGGLDSEVLPDTNSIVLESATFEPSTVRKTAIRLGLRTEASSRYEKSLDPNMAILATRRFIYILKELNPNLSFSSTITDVYPTIQKENEITLNKDLLYKYMGFKIDDEVVKNILTSLEFKVTINKDNYLVTAPTFRSTKDITIAADVIEEISRMYGYENFEHLPLKMDVTFMPKEESFDSEYDLKYYLSVKYHLHEINTYLWNKTSFLKKLNININNVKLLGKTDDNILRNDLSLSMLENASYNIKNYENFGLFEIGTTIINNECERHLSIILVSDLDKIKDSYYQIKDIATNIYKELKNLNVKFNTSKAEAYYNNDLTMSITGNDQVLGEIKVFNREVSNKISKKKAFVVLDLNIDTFTNLPIIVNNYTEISKYPTTVLDYTIITKKGTFYENLDSILNKFSSPIILKRELVDIYLNDENKKVTIRYTVGAQDKTLTSEELTNFKEEFIKFINQNGLSITLE